jgi:hypothetical protein
MEATMFLMFCIVSSCVVTLHWIMYLQVRAQHMERAVSFLVKELKVCTQKEANERIFFVSAKEALQARLLEQNGQPVHSKNKTPT